MPNTITFTPFTSTVSLAEINAFFTDVATVLNAKLDRDGGVMAADLHLGGCPVLNVPYAVADDEPVPRKQFIELGGIV